MYISTNDKKTFQSILLLDYVQRNEVKTVLNGDDKLLEPLLIELMSKGLVSVSGLDYDVTASGKTIFDNFMKRYQEYLKFYDVFGFVDLDKGEFAFSKYFDFETDASWEAFKTNPRFEDLRLAVAMFKKLNPSEIVFMSFINEGRFETNKTAWQMDLLSDVIWNEIEEICSTALKPEQLGEDAMKDMIEQGSEIVVDILKQEEQRNKEIVEQQAQYNDGDVEVVEETVVETTYYDSYYYESYMNPYYVSPFWLVPLILW